MTSRPVETRRFRGFADAPPTAVWAALTGSRAISAYLYGLGIESSWEDGAPIHVRSSPSSTAGHLSLTGVVLRVEPPCRLSYLLQSGAEDPPVYLTWLIRPCRDGCTIELQVDDVGAADSEEEAEDRWLPVLAALQTHLARGTAAS
jgi:uncharacterized protein YndB with AHSA1/START domain